MVKCMLTSDTHYGMDEKTHSKHLRFWKKAAKAIEEENVQVLIWAGDIASHRQRHLRQSIEMVREHTKIPIVIVKGNHDCLDKDTELLTKRGWINYREINKDDKVLSMDENNNSVWTGINDIIIKKSKYIYKYKNNNIDMAVTEKHRIPHYKRLHNKVFSKLEYKNINDLTGRVALPTSRHNINEDVDLSDDEIRLFAWILTDGSASGGSYHIYQSKLDGVEKIKTILNNLQYEYTLKFRNRNITHICGKKLKSILPQGEFRIKAKYYTLLRKYIKEGKEMDLELFRSFSSRQLRLLIITMMDGDGSWGRTKNHGALNGTYDELSVVQSLAAECGIRAGLVEYMPGSFRLNLSFNRENNQTDTLSRKVKKEIYEDDVWCLNVPNTNFMVRRNGKSYFTGNCWDGDDPKCKERTPKGLRTLDKLFELHKELFKENDIHHLENNPFIIDDVIICGFDGWYDRVNPGTNDSKWMPKYVQGQPIVESFLVNKAWKDLDTCLAVDTEKYRKSMLVTHHNPYSYSPSPDYITKTADKLISQGVTLNRHGANLRFLPEIREKFDVLCCGHTHIYKNDKREGIQIYNSGSDYNNPKFMIFDI